MVQRTVWQAIPKFYGGFEIQREWNTGERAINFNGFALTRIDNKPFFDRWGGGATLFAGVRFCENFGLEAGFTWMKRLKIATEPFVIGVSGRGHTNNGYGDLIGYLPVAKTVDLIAALGLGVMDSKATIHGRRQSYSARSTQAGVRVGMGGQWKCSHIGARLMFRYQTGDRFVKNVGSIALGMFYQF